MILKIKGIEEFLGSQDYQELIGQKVCNLDKPMPNISTSIIPGDDVGFLQKPTTEPILWNYFITCAFPQGHKFNIKHKEYIATSCKYPLGYKITNDEIKYRDCSVQEQYQWIIYNLSKYLHHSVVKYDIFFELCFSGDLHFHGRIQTELKYIKDIKVLFHRMFNLSLKHKYFCDVKVYDDKKWNDYDVKIKKTYQTTSFKHFTNI